MPLKPTEKSRLQNRNLGIRMTKRILETTRVKFHECLPKRARIEAKGKAEEGELQGRGGGAAESQGGRAFTSWR